MQHKMGNTWLFESQKSENDPITPFHSGQDDEHVGNCAILKSLLRVVISSEMRLVRQEESQNGENHFLNAAHKFVFLIMLNTILYFN